MNSFLSGQRPKIPSKAKSSYVNRKYLIRLSKKLVYIVTNNEEICLISAKYQLITRTDKHSKKQPFCQAPHKPPKKIFISVDKSPWKQKIFYGRI